MTLRPYQLAATDALWNNLDRHVYASLPTGSGKSHIIAELCRRALEYPETRLLVITHSKELVQQDKEKIEAALPNVDVAAYCAGLREKRIGIVTVASIQSIHKARHDLPSIDIIIVDEAHRIPHGEVGQYRDLFAAQPDARVIGLTATPYRLKGGLLHEGDDAIFDDLVCEIKTSDLIEQRYLSPVRARAGSEHADTTELHVRGGEFINAEMQEAFDKSDLNRAVVRDVMQHAAGRTSIMVFCTGVEHCDHVALAFLGAGERSVSVVTGNTPHRERDAIIAEFKARNLRILINCDVLTTGFDAPNVDCIVMLRATKSPGLYVQILGRGLRIAEGKTDCLFLDYGENVERHGPLDDITAERVESGDGPAPMKTCPQCQDMVYAGKRECLGCGYIWTVEQVELALAAQAGTRDPIKATSIDVYPVAGVRYVLHKPPGKPPMMRAEYRTGMATFFNQFVCVEHTNGARYHAEKWFARHGAIAPRTAEEAIKVAKTLIKPKAITVKTGAKFPEIINYEF